MDQPTTICKIIITGTARTEHKNLEDFDGISSSDLFSYYLRDEALKQKGVSGGRMYFEYNKVDRQLYTITAYESKHLLAEQELQRLVDYTLGQWCDGIGEEFQQNPCRYINNKPIYVCAGEFLTVTQEEVETYDKYY